MMDFIMKASFREVDFILRNAPFVQLAPFPPLLWCLGRNFFSLLANPCMMQE